MGSLAYCYLVLMRRKALASFMLLLLLVSMPQFFSLVKANPVPYPPEPSQEFPTLKINSPKNGEVFTVTTAEINFSVTKPDSWNLYWLTAIPVIGSYVVLVYLDGSLHSRYFDPCSTGFPTQTISVYLNKLTRGGHSVKIDVEAYTYYENPTNPTPGSYLTYSRNITETIHFTVNADLPTPTPSPTPSPRPTSKPESFPTTLVIAPVSIVAVVGVGLLIYFKKRKNVLEIKK